MGIFDERKIDCHAHILGPARFPYAPDAAYKPSGYLRRRPLDAIVTRSQAQRTQVPQIKTRLKRQRLTPTLPMPSS